MSCGRVPHSPTRPSRSRKAHARALPIGLLAMLLALWSAGPALAQIYRWTDEQGRLHFAQDLSQVPPKYRAAAAGGAVEEGQGPQIQQYRQAPAALAPGRASRRASPSGASASKGRVHRIKVPRTGSSMRVNVRLNDRVTAPFIIDTGASDVSVPEWVAKELGLDLEGARTHFYRTANGTIQKQVVILESVDLGGARVSNVPASISKTMSIGLLGLSYFNHFHYRIDPVAGVITLEDNGMVESGGIRGGRSEVQWRNEFRLLASRREAIETLREQAGSNRSRQREQLEAAIEEVERQLEVLEDEADEARVPMSWRD